MNKKKKQHLINREIRANEVRVAEHGIVSLNEALALAEADELDLVLINDKATPPVCKIMNYEKFIYEQGKKSKQKALETKEVKLGPNTAENDLAYRTKHIIEFLQKGHRVKLSMRFKGREMMYVNKGMELMLKLILSVEKHGVSDALPKLEGKQIIANLKPISK